MKVGSLFGRDYWIEWTWAWTHPHIKEVSVGFVWMRHSQFSIHLLLGAITIDWSEWWVQKGRHLNAV